MGQIKDIILVWIANTFLGGDGVEEMPYPEFSWRKLVTSLGYGVAMLLLIAVFGFLGIVGLIAG